MLAFLRAMTPATHVAAALALGCSVMAGTGAFAQEARPGPPKQHAAAAAETRTPVADATSHHVLDAGGIRLSYTATAGTLPLAGDKDEIAAHVFFTAYVLEAAPGRRPITFVFNGGPGAASAFLHLGAIGPRVVPFNQAGSAPAEPVRLADNPDAWLGFTDLVFVDPVGTGYSRATGGKDAARDKFYGVAKDAEAMTQFVRLYLARSGRTLDPVFVAGESYGGFRAALLTKRLLREGFDMRGAVLISPVLEFSLIRGDDVTLLPIALQLPSIAFSHAELTGAKSGVPDLSSEVEAFALGPYLTHLAAGRRADPAIDAVLSRYTGLSASEIARRHGRVTVDYFLSAYRRANDRVLSRYDGAVSVPVPRPAGSHHADPILDFAVAALSPAFVTYARAELGFATDLDYKLLNREVSGHWDYGAGPGRQGYAGALDDLQAARTQRPSLQVLIAGGTTDLVTPYAASRYLIDQLEPLEGAAPIRLKLYAGGHMMYLRAASRKALAADARAMIEAALR